MQVVIDIDEYDYKKAKQLVSDGVFDYNGTTAHLFRSVVNGTPLPKGHGRLIDADRLKEEMEKDVRRAMSFVDLTDFVWLAHTIIDDDKEK